MLPASSAGAVAGYGDVELDVAERVNEFESRVWTGQVQLPPVLDELKGFAATTLSRRSPYTMERAYLRQKSDAVFGADFERGGRYDNCEGSDAHAVEQGLVSITKLSTLQAIARTI